jgi:nicotinamidase-related amidase
MIKLKDSPRLGDCALIIIDMQHDFVDKDGPIPCLGAEQIIPSIAAFAQWARGKGIPIIYTREIHREEKVDFGLEIRRSEPEHCIDGSRGAEIVQGLTPVKGDFVLVKRRYSSFYLTDLELLMKGLGRNTLIIAGAATNVCVYATALDAMQRDMVPLVLEDCVAGTDVDLHRAFLKNIDYVLGDVMQSQDLIDYFDAAGCESRRGGKEMTSCR